MSNNIMPLPEAVNKILSKSSVREGKHGLLIQLSGHIFIARNVAHTRAFGFNSNERCPISKFSASSAARMRKYLRECLAKYVVFGTLTYPCGFPLDGRTCKEHLRRFLQEVKRKCARDNPSTFHRYSTFWFLEFQGRGAPHFHFFSTHFIDHEWLSKTWYRIVGSEDVRHLNAGTSIEAIRSGRHGISAYAAKYANKSDQKEVPEEFENVGRFWGVTGYKATVVASTLFEPKHAAVASIERAKNQVFDIVKTAINEGRARVVKRELGTLVVSINGTETIDKLSNKIWLLGAKTSNIMDYWNGVPMSHEDKMIEADDLEMINMGIGGKNAKELNKPGTTTAI